MRVLFWSCTFWPHIGGVEVLATRVLPALRERGYEFIVVTQQNSPDIPAEAEYEGIPVYRFPFWSMLHDKNIDRLMAIQRKLAKLKRAFAPDLVHLNSVNSPCSFFYRTTTNAHAAPYVVTLHIDLPHDFVGPGTLPGQLIRSAAWVTACAKSLLADAHRLFPEIVPRSSVIHNGLDTPSRSPEPLPSDRPRLLCLGRLATQKGFDVALRAMASIVERYPHVRLVLAGDGPERLALERQAHELGIMDVVDFVGWVGPDRVPALINASTVVVMPSRWEGFPLVALEAALMARPIVATPVDGLVEIVQHQQTGLLVEPEDSEGLAEAIAYLLDQPETAQRFGQAARRHIQEVFSFERHVNAYDELYQKLMASWRGTSGKARHAT